jgi:uncharacterized membrane protein YphA (DoxX/SURF4 family)
MVAALVIYVWNPHHREPLNSVSPDKGWDVNLLLVAALAVLALLAGGRWSLDSWVGLSPWLF